MHGRATRGQEPVWSALKRGRKDRLRSNEPTAQSRKAQLCVVRAILRNGNRYHLCRGSGIDRNEADEATGRVD